MSNIIQEEIEKIRKMMLSENMVQEGGEKKLKETLNLKLSLKILIWMKINFNSICKLNRTKYNKKITSIKFNYFEYYILYL
jgi:hypothetical protein